MSKPPLQANVPKANEVELLFEETMKKRKETSIICKFLEKRTQIEEEYAKNITKLCKAQPHIVNTGIGDVFSMLVETTMTMAAVHQTASTQLATGVVEPLQTLNKSFKAELQAVHAEGVSLLNERKETYDLLKKLKTNYEHASRDPELEPLKVEELEEEYKKQIEIVNQYQTVYHAQKLPKLCYEFQRIETLRMQKVKTHMKRFIMVLGDIPPQNESRLMVLSEKIAALDTKIEIQEFATFCKTINHKLPDVVFESAERNMPKKGSTWKQKASGSILPKMGMTLRKAKSQSIMYSSAAQVTYPAQRPATAVFGVTLEEIMQKQKAKFPDLDIPRVLIVLVDQVKRLNGLQTEGIFRIPGLTNEVQQIKERLDQGGEYNPAQSSVVHTAASVLKLWLRELPDPLIPVSQYKLCIECNDVEQVAHCFSLLPPINQRAISFLLHFFRELTARDNVALTRMDTENLAVVFGPSFLRSPSAAGNGALAQAIELIENVHKECHFVKLLLETDSILLPQPERVTDVPATTPPTVLSPPLNWRPTKPVVVSHKLRPT